MNVNIYMILKDYYNNKNLDSNCNVKIEVKEKIYFICNSILSNK